MPALATQEMPPSAFYQVAQQMGLKSEILDPVKGFFTLSKAEKQVLCCESLLLINTVTLNNLMDNKSFAMRLLNKAGAPTPDTETYELTATAADVLARTNNRFPLVAKPIAGACSRGVTLNIQSEAELTAAIQTIREMSRVAGTPQYQKQHFLLERHVWGKDYRILMHHDTVVDIVERIPANVVGDGRATIEELIPRHNAMRHVFLMDRPIVIDDELFECLAMYGKTLQSIPQPGETVHLRKRFICGETKHIPNQSISPDNLELFQRIHRATGLKISGIDFISPDITVSYRDIPCCVNEINPRPGVYINGFVEVGGPRTGPVEDILRRELEL